MNKELMTKANPFRNKKSHYEPWYSTTSSSHSGTFLYEKYLIDNFPHLLTPNLDKEAKKDIKSYLISQIALCEKDIEQANRLEKEYNDIIYCKSRHEEFWQAVCRICFLDPLTVYQTKTIKYYSHLLKQLAGVKPSTNGVSEEQIIVAKKYPITELINFNRHNVACCFAHSEKSPSLHYYSKTNTAHCFGSCSKTFDSIEIYKTLHNCSFVEAVRKLQ
jgi:hypothetical protein